MFYFSIFPNKSEAKCRVFSFSKYGFGEKGKKRRGATVASIVAPLIEESTTLLRSALLCFNTDSHLSHFPSTPPYK